MISLKKKFTRSKFEPELENQKKKSKACASLKIVSRTNAYS